MPALWRTMVFVQLPPVLMIVLTQNRANTLECVRTRGRSSKRSTPRNPRQAGLTGAADRSDRCKQGVTGNLEQRAREGPRRSS